MDLLLIRHALAEDREAFARTGAGDDRRPLVEKGRKRMVKAARNLTAMVTGIDLLYTSPYLRARQTADLVAEAFGLGAIRETELLQPGTEPEAVLSWLQAERPMGTVAMVGHEPDLGELVSLALCGHGHSFVPLKKGGACLVSFGPRIEPGMALLRWCSTNSQLRKYKG
ncbi:MAG: histidine phosphatase family protein [Chromatiales bacterium]|nr:histidine phosphatase family protein [Chromatiales bacterium]